MKRAWQGVGICALVIALGLLSGRVSFGRLTTAASDDIWCEGPSGAEVCIDVSGNLIPTTDNDTTLGSSSLRWSDVRTLDATVSDDLTVTGDLTVGATLVHSGVASFAKTAVGSVGSAAGGITVSTTIPVTTNYESLISTGSTITLTSLPNVSTATVVGGSTELSDGTFLILTSTAAYGGVLLQDEDTLTGTRLQLGAGTRLVDQYNTLILIYDAVDNFWREAAFIAN